MRTFDKALRDSPDGNSRREEKIGRAPRDLACQGREDKLESIGLNTNNVIDAGIIEAGAQSIRDSRPPTGLLIILHLNLSMPPEQVEGRRRGHGQGSQDRGKQGAGEERTEIFIAINLH